MSQQQAQSHDALYVDLAEVIRKAAAHLDPDDTRLLCYGCGVDPVDTLPRDEDE